MGTESLRNVDTKHFSQTQWLPIKKRKAWPPRTDFLIEYNEMFALFEKLGLYMTY
jgi:hypothetical protein